MDVCHVITSGFTYAPVERPALRKVGNRQTIVRIMTHAVLLIICHVIVNELCTMEMHHMQSTCLYEGCRPIGFFLSVDTQSDSRFF